MILADDVFDVGYSWWEIAKVALVALFVSAATIHIMAQLRGPKE